MRIMVTGGGTGGHTSPAAAVVEELRRRDPGLELRWVGRRGGIEERVCSRLEIPFRAIAVAGWPRRNRARQAWVGAVLALGMVQSWLLLRRFQPQVVFGVGGYVSLPLGYVAQRMGIPVVVHEQNRLLGMANRVLAPRAAQILLSYPDTAGSYPAERSKAVGNPVRPAFAHPPASDAARAALGLDPSVPVVLVIGGSQGARTLNSAVSEALSRLAEGEMQLIWMTGPGDAAAARVKADQASVRVHVHPFIDDIVTAYSAADLVVARSGASTTAELATLGKPAVLVPYPHAAENHQEQNARALEAGGAAVVLLDRECSGERLLHAVRDLLSDGERLAAMGKAAALFARPEAADRIADCLLTLVFEDPEVVAVTPGWEATQPQQTERSSVAEGDE